MYGIYLNRRGTLIKESLLICIITDNDKEILCEIHFRFSAGNFLIYNVKTLTLIKFTYWTVRTMYVRLCTCIISMPLYRPVRPKNFHSECYQHQICMYGLVRTLYVHLPAGSANNIVKPISQRTHASVTTIILF